MAQKIFQSFRRIPGHFPAFRKKEEHLDVQGSRYRVSVCSDYGFPSKPTSVAYDPVIDMLAVLTRDGNIYVYGKPGISFSAVHETNAQYIQVVFLTGSRKLITLTDSDDMYLWELTSVSQTSCQLVQRSCLKRIISQLKSLPTGVPSISTNNEETSHVTALCYASDGRSILIGTDNGWVASVRLNTNTATDDFTKFWCLPSADDAINPSRILDGISPDRRQRLRADAVVVLLERPGFPGQLLIGYNSGLSLLFDLRSDRIMALLPWQHGLEAAAWCGGSGQPNRSNPTSHQPQLGMRLLTAHSDGSLGVWSLKEIGFGTTTISPIQPPLLQMEEAPSMPYGPFPCKLISKVFWLPSDLGGITVFVGGMPRATYGERHTVSILRGSNIDQAANASVVAARLAVAAEAEDDDEIPEESSLSAPPIHVFDSDAPEHVCLDLPSSLVDLVPVGSVDGPVQILILLCEEEMVVIDLITSGWPFMRPPYLTCLHTTSLTTYNLITQVSPTLLSNLEAAGAYYGPEGRFGRGGAIADNPSGGGWSSLPWPIQGGHALINGSRLSTSSLGGNILYTDDLLLTGHEDGSVAFWRLSAGGCLRRIYTLYTAILFEDVSQLLRKCFSNKITVNPEQATPLPAQLQATGVIFVQPPARITSLLSSEFELTHLKEFSQNQTSNIGGDGGLQILLALGTPHGFGVVFVPKPLSNNDSNTKKPLPPQPLLAVSTIPDNIDALQEAAAGEGWARRRTRELKKSLRDSFRRLKRVRSTKSNFQPVVPAFTANVSRAGIRRTVTQSNRAAPNQTDVAPLDEAERRSGRVPDENILLISQYNIEREICDRVQDTANVAIVSCFAFGPPLFKSSPSNSRPMLHSVATLFIGTKAGTVKLYSIFVDKTTLNSSVLPKLQLYYSRELILQHRAPVLSLRLIDAKSNMPYSLSDYKHYISDSGKSHNLPVLSVVSEEQIRLFNLPNLHLKFKARITAIDGYRIKSASVVGFRIHGKTSSSLSKESTVDSACGDLERSNASGISVTSQTNQNCEYSFVFTNVGGQAVLLSMPQLRRMDTLHLLDSHDVVAVSSVVFSQPGSINVNTSGYVPGPALGLYQLAPGQLTLFDVVRSGQKASSLGVSYRPIYRLSLIGNPNANMKTLSEKTNSTGDSRISNRSVLSTSQLHNISQTSSVLSSSVQNQSNSMSSHNLSDSIRNGLVSPSVSCTSDRNNHRNRVS
ncbi:unnamed protein product [Schistosoma margrebowiei]|uniref:Lethal giant larvae homologue 2 domain-containing protein n=2 Tax=Schistosoma margrebowiei TaxID=48269 RepID=A0AA84Z4S9_9TREM|nr:unnamed protein product [Schistosoma margrebowiei]